MSTPNMKKVPTTLRRELAPRQPASAGRSFASNTAAVFSAADVERSADLGGGYVLVKFRDSPPATIDNKDMSVNPVARLDTNFPKIPRTKVKGLLERYASPTKASRLTDNRDNDEFTAVLNSQSLLSRLKHLNDGLLLTSSDICQRLAFSRQALSKAVKEFRIFSVVGPSNAQLYPAFFASEKPERRELERVSQALGDMPGPSKWEFFITPKTSLGGRSPVVAIAEGDLQRVLAAASGFKGR
ncbi:hypothetical protein ACFOLJ_15235 [Rugamonas sp. CCM 8940]|uniref:hypothetical protein n=1 Tax=Rugamonas sp. CCM 8940 TaxID=2765359 RepID=UPI0018F292A9|nr:hypothetical protein [Rugamonas sp. CCM 8940]MBJ7313718.1 hypothetical protein [Rugamonas sp. CCM 8940]